MGKSRKKSNTLRHKRLKRVGRFQAAKHWIFKYDGKNIVKGYSKHFAVDKPCAINELQMLGYKINPEYIDALKATLKGEQKAGERRKELEKEKKALEEYLNSDSDGTFYYIAGYISGGAPYGITWDEFEKENGVEGNTLFEDKEDLNFEDNILFKNEESLELQKDNIPF